MKKQMKNKQVNNDNNKVVLKNGWDPEKNKSTYLYLHKLKYNQVVNNFFFFQLKSKESLMSWWLIILSTFSTTLTGLNNLEKEPFKHFFLSIQIGLGVSSIFTTLIAAWMKKKQFVERINEIDRYVQKLTRLIEEINFQLLLTTEDRIKYDDFKNKYHQQVSEMLSTSPSLSPKEWKHTIYILTKYYPEMINSDGTYENKLWPWFTLGIDKEGGIVRRVGQFGGKVIKTYHTSTYKGYIIYKCCPCFYNNKILYPDPSSKPPPPRKSFCEKYCSCLKSKKVEKDTQTYIHKESQTDINKESQTDINKESQITPQILPKKDNVKSNINEKLSELI